MIRRPLPTLAAPQMCSVLLAAAGAAFPAAAQDAPPAPAPAPASHEGILPIPDFSADLWSRHHLLGDLGGARTDLANAGVQFGIDWNNTFQAVVSGGRQETSAYGGTLDFNLTLDLMRMGLLPGAVVTMRGESRYGESINGDTGALLPASSDMVFPLTADPEEGVPFTITTLSYTQFFSESFGVFLGKFDTLSGDANEFASGRGLTQFQNLNLIFSPSPLVTVPYSTLGGGLFWKPHPFITLTSSIMTTSDSSTTTGFDNLDEGWTWSAEAQFQYRLGRLPGGVNVGGSYAFDNDFATIGRRFVFRPGEGITPTPDEDSSWAVYASAWQYLVADEPANNADAPLNPADGAPDRKGFGLFARIGFADEETNPVELAVSGGVGGRGVIPGRDRDLFGVGYFYNQARTGRLATIAGVEESTQGGEAFYNLVITPAVQLSFDVQVIEPVRDTLDTAVVLGTRLLVRF